MSCTSYMCKHYLSVWERRMFSELIADPARDKRTTQGLRTFTTLPRRRGSVLSEILPLRARPMIAQRLLLLTVTTGTPPFSVSPNYVLVYVSVLVSFPIRAGSISSF